MQSFSLALAACAMAMTACATKVFVTHSPPTDPGSATVWAIDTAAGTGHLVAKQAKAQITAVSGSIVCGGKYYAVTTDFASMSFGLFSVDLAQNATNSTGLVLMNTESLFHVMVCDPKSPSDLLVVASDSALVADPTTQTLKPGVGASFKLKRYTVATGNETIVGTFPAKISKWDGYDTIFNFKADGSEVWAAWPADICPDCPDAKEGGHLEVMDTATGAITKSVAISDGLLSPHKASPYMVLPDAMRGIFDDGEGRNHKWADLKFAGGKLTFKQGAAVDGLHLSGAPFPICQGTWVSMIGKGEGIAEVKTADGSRANEFDFGKLPIQNPGTDWFGGVACDTTGTPQGTALIV